MTRTSEDLQRDAAALIKESADVKACARELAHTADELRDKVAKLHIAIGKTQSPLAR